MIGIDHELDVGTIAALTFYVTHIVFYGQAHFHFNGFETLGDVVFGFSYQIFDQCFAFRKVKSCSIWDDLFRCCPPSRVLTGNFKALPLISHRAMSMALMAAKEHFFWRSQSLSIHLKPQKFVFQWVFAINRFKQRNPLSDYICGRILTPAIDALVSGYFYNTDSPFVMGHWEKKKLCSN